MKFVLILALTIVLTGCNKLEKEKAERKIARSNEFVSVYIKKYPTSAGIVSKYDSCVRNRDEMLEKCIFSSSHNDIDIYILNQYLAARQEYLKDKE